MTDIKRNGLFNQKREIYVGVYNPTEAEILAVAAVANLPERSLVTNVYTNVLTASGTASSQITVKVGAVAVATNVAVATTGIKTTTTPGYFATGGEITIIGGTTPPANGALVVEVVIEYVELDKTSGEYTAY
mgnify:CR=1 FL=1